VPISVTSPNGTDLRPKGTSPVDSVKGDGVLGGLGASGG